MDKAKDMVLAKSLHTKSNNQLHTLLIHPYRPPTPPPLLQFNLKQVPTVVARGLFFCDPKASRQELLVVVVV
jgi:hypothetical protein